MIYEIVDSIEDMRAGFKKMCGADVEVCVLVREDVWPEVIGSAKAQGAFLWESPTRIAGAEVYKVKGNMHWKYRVLLRGIKDDKV